MLDLIISGPRIYTEQGMLPNANLSVRDGVIESVFANAKVDALVTPHATSNENALNNAHAHIEFPSSYHLVPGFIDLHVHGANNQDVMDATPEALAVISKTLAEEGTTAYLATTMTADSSEIEKTLINVRHSMQNSSKGAALLGVHLEGPFISPKKAGAQLAEKILPPSIELFAHWQTLSGNNIKLVTLAPELPGSHEMIRYLKQHNVIASIGHSDATYDETMAAIKEGCHYVTHLFNAMRGIHQREPGVVTAALLENVLTELIVDGVHLHPAIVQLILKLKTKDKMILVTDAMRAKCLTDGQYDLGGQSVTVKKGEARLADGTLAGSTLKMPNAIHNMLRFTQCTLEDAITMASENPARLLRIYDKKGSIAVGKDADFVVLDEDLNVVMTVCRGKVVHQRVCETQFF